MRNNRTRAGIRRWPRVRITFAREGADVAMVHLLEEEEDARETERWMRDEGRKFARWGVDIRSEVWTPLIPSTMPKEKVKNFGKSSAFRRPAQPVEIAPLFVFLAPNEARFVSGEVYGATGGQTPY